MSLSASCATKRKDRRTRTLVKLSRRSTPELYINGHRHNGHRHKFKIDESRTYRHSALSMHCYIEHRDNFNFDIFKFGIVKKVQPSLLDREESRFCTKFKTNVWGLNRMEIKR